MSVTFVRSLSRCFIQYFGSIAVRNCYCIGNHVFVIMVKVLTAFVGVAAASDWEDYKNQFGKVYNGDDDVRHAIFDANMKFITAENAKGHSYTLGLGPFTDMTSDEFKALQGYTKPEVEEPVLGVHQRASGCTSTRGRCAGGFHRHAGAPPGSSPHHEPWASSYASRGTCGTHGPPSASACRGVHRRPRYRRSRGSWTGGP